MNNGPGQPKKDKPASFAISAYLTAEVTKQLLRKVRKEKVSVSAYVGELIRKDLEK